MGRRGGPRPGVRFLVLGLAAPAVLCATGCAGPSGSPHPPQSPAAPTSSPGSAAASSPAPGQPASDADLCARLITYWSREVLDGDSYGDYQSMGLSHGQYEILRDVVDAARPVKHRQGSALADKLIVRQARTACTERYRHGTPSGGPWT
ncbi:hypothetical protein ACIP4Y_05460 [Streptomyces sp. NPDC088810]|uniref:hypothetical protein n=1 Tax=Streptomyces sp. NPDC088810 TaxID=3365904 RepID=UPI00380B3732